MNSLNALRALLWHLERAEKSGDVSTAIFLRRMTRPYLCIVLRGEREAA